MRIDQLPTFEELLAELRQLEDDCCGFDNYHGWGIGICKHNIPDPDAYKTFNNIIEAGDVDVSWIEKQKKEISLLFDKYFIPLERKDTEWHETLSKEEILNSLKIKWTEEWFENNGDGIDVYVEWGNEAQIAELLLKFLKGLKKLYQEK